MGVEKFVDPEKTTQGKPRAVVPLTDLKTLWINTGTRCNLQCENCYIESTPTNDSLEYITSKQVQTYLDEIYQLNLQTKEIGLTGGEPFLNPNLIKIITLCLERNFNLLILTNGYKVIDRYKDQLQFLNSQYHNQLNLRFSLDHYSLEVHEKERGSGTFHPTLRNIKWFAEQGFNISIAGRSLIHEKMATALHGY
ncbi:radical SAM protein, partial [Candidatus Woesearchaeota archaeon CG10_big_fil_rev_8_21_14_0_10_34_8]